MSVKTINRRTLNHSLASVLDAVIETREPIRVEGRDGRAVIIEPEPEREETPWERWNRLGTIIKGRQSPIEEWDSLRGAEGVSSDWILKEMEEWR
jgi:hypothetical protein